MFEFIGRLHRAIRGIFMQDNKIGNSHLGLKAKGGEISVSATGEAEFLIDFEPTMVEAYFIDETPPAPCCEADCLDRVGVRVSHVRQCEWGVRVFWKVGSKRNVKWIARK